LPLRRADFETTLVERIAIRQLARGFGKADHAFDFTALPAARHSGHS
jgi:hypothetical protein